jgi:peroxiredoxin
MARVELNAAAPEFELLDWHGNTVRLSDFRDKKHVVLVFNRTFA